MSQPSRTVLIISGPTSTGKTSLGLEIAKEIDAVILSADSRQIYKYTDIGTGKLPINSEVPVTKESDRWVINDISIYGYDLISPDKNYSAFDFCNYGRGVLSKFISQGKNVIVVGGTGFYIDTLIGKVTPSNVAPNAQLRGELNNLPLSDLQDKLKNLSLDVFNGIDNKNKVRIIRAIEKLTLPSKPIEMMDLPENVFFTQIGLKTTNEKMFSVADKWTNTIWKNGLIEETAALIKSGYENTAPLNGFIYKTAKDYLKGLVKEDAAIERVSFDMHAYIRRQLTWFNKNPEIQWFEITEMSKDQIKSALMNIFSV